MSEKEFVIKLPPANKGVNEESLWRTINTISKTGYTFTIDQLISSGLHTSNKDVVSRILAYLKYLDVLKEERGTATAKGQKFVIENSKIKDIIYEIKASREAEAKRKWQEYLRKHQLIQYILKEFFKNETAKTFIDLEHFLKNSLGSEHSPDYYQSGGKALIGLLLSCEVVKVDENDILLNKSDEKNKGSEQPNLFNLNEESFQPESPINDASKNSHSETKADNTNQSIVQHTQSQSQQFDLKNHVQNAEVMKDEYFITIKTPNTIFNMAIKDEIDLTVIEKLLQKVKIEIQNL